MAMRTTTRPRNTSTRGSGLTRKNPVDAYAIDVLEDKIIAGPHVRNACRRHFDDMERGHERGLVCYVFCTFFDPNSGMPAFELQQIGRCFAQGGSPSGEDLAAYGLVDILDGLEKDAAFMMGCRRNQKLTNPASPEREPFYSVGSLTPLAHRSTRSHTN